VPDEGTRSDEVEIARRVIVAIQDLLQLAGRFQPGKEFADFLAQIVGTLWQGPCQAAR